MRTCCAGVVKKGEKTTDGPTFKALFRSSLKPGSSGRRLEPARGECVPDPRRGVTDNHMIHSCDGAHIFAVKTFSIDQKDLKIKIITNQTYAPGLSDIAFTEKLD